MRCRGLSQSRWFCGSKWLTDKLLKTGSIVMGSIAVYFSNSANLSLDMHMQVLFQLQYFCYSEMLSCTAQEVNASQQLRKQPCCGGLTLAADCQVPRHLGLSLYLLNRTWGENSMGSFLQAEVPFRINLLH